IDPAYKKDITGFIDKFADVLHEDDQELWLCVQPSQELDYIDFEALSDNVDRFVAMLFDETSDTDPPGPIASRSWFEGWVHVLLEDSDTKQWIFAIGSYGYDWTIGAKKAEMISFSEAMSRANDAEIESAEVQGPGYSPYFYFRSDTDPPGPIASRSWFEGWVHVLLEDSDTKQWIFAIGSYGYDWTIGAKKAEMISFSEAMSRANDAEIESAEVQGPGYSPYFYF